MAAHVGETRQSAFTWTGPYGGGKSSLALAFSCLFGPTGGARAKAEAVFGEEVVGSLRSNLPSFPARWTVLPLVMERRSIADQLSELVELPVGSLNADFLEALRRRVRDGPVVLMLDELGRALEAAADGDGDLDLLQDLAELASRSDGRLIVIGILHQSFGDYAERLGRKARDSWAKIQGRYVDIPISVSLEETVELIAEAIGPVRGVRKAMPLARRCVDELRPALDKDAVKGMARKLARTYPLHPFTACLLGPLSKRRFGQNQRSVFSFLNSSEPFGLQDALSSGGEFLVYPPHLLWNYLVANFDAAILSSPDGRRWALAHDAVDRAAARGADEMELAVLKVVGILELLKDRSSLAASPSTIALCLHEQEAPKVMRALEVLERHSEVVFRKHSGLYRLYAGSDFDVEAAMDEALARSPIVDLGELRALADLQPILAKRHHGKTGAMRWFETSIEPLSKLRELEPPPERQDLLGKVAFALPLDGEREDEAAGICCRAVLEADGYPLVVGYHPDAGEIVQLIRELVAFGTFNDQFPQLRGDPVARREIDARIAQIRQRLEMKLAALVDECEWFTGGVKPARLTKRLLNEHLSRLAEGIYPSSPLILNELLNCSEPSSNAVSARTKLLKRMTQRSSDAGLGFTGANHPAERGLYISLLERTGIHGDGGFTPPAPDGLMRPLWDEADKLLAATDGIVEGNAIIAAWGRPPIGLKAGLGPVFFVAYLLSRRESVAVYSEGKFQAGFSELDVEILARNPADIALRKVDMTGVVGATLRELSQLLGIEGVAAPLVVAREIVGQFDNLVPWTSRTQTLSPLTLKVREILKRASDPNKLLFDDLPRLGPPSQDGVFDAQRTALMLRNALAEMRAAYPAVLEDLKELVLKELDVRDPANGGIAELRQRADNIRHIGGDLRLEAFVGRLTQFHGTREDMEGLAGVAGNKLPSDWNDGDRERAVVGLAELAAGFLKMETMARVKGRKDGRHAMAVVMSRVDMPRSLFSEFQVSDQDIGKVDRLAQALDETIGNGGGVVEEGERGVILAALVKVASRYFGSDDEPLLKPLFQEEPV
ncbi:hypothetical protein [Novosphingopyxis sp.]|uniref:hypothetical protein n=1 Tax=Novosphingopyxis sp. TaxID=2709690 RepID=UPI003B5C8BCA